MIVSMSVLESRQMGDIQNHEPQTWWLRINASTLSVLTSLSTGSKYFKVWLKIGVGGIYGIGFLWGLQILHLGFLFQRL